MGWGGVERAVGVERAGGVGRAVGATEKAVQGAGLVAAVVSGMDRHGGCQLSPEARMLRDIRRIG